MTLPRDILMAYVDGELDATDAARVEAAMAADPATAAEVARHRHLRDLIAGTHAEVLVEPVPARLLAAALGGATPCATVVPIDATKKHDLRRRWSWPEWTAMAASLLVGVLFAQWIVPTADTPVLVRADAAVLAHGVLADALETRVSGDGPAGGVSIGLSFRDQAGGYCRTFVLAQDQPLAGLACRDEVGWRVRLLAEGQAGPAGELRMAATALPLVVLEAVDARIDGEPLDAGAERAARKSGWQ
jgi:hypothetical protein